MFFASDNAGPALPQVMDAVISANTGYQMPYGADTLMVKLREEIRQLFEAPKTEVFLVATGTAANALALACYTQPWQTVFCSCVAHIHKDECNAPEFFSGGAKLTLVGETGRMSPQELRDAIEGEETRGVHGPQRGAVSITQATENGGVYSLEEITALCDVAKAFNLPVHMDGARFANALVSLDARPAQMTWQAGVDVLSFGGTKNGCAGVEAVIFFDPQKAWEFELRRKRAAHLFSKHRFLSAQMLGYLQDDAWLDAAKNANAHATYLNEALQARGIEVLHRVEANIVFARFSRELHQKLHAAGAVYYVMDGEVEHGAPQAHLTARFVCDWSIGYEQIDAFIDLIDQSASSM